MGQKQKTRFDSGLKQKENFIKPVVGVKESEKRRDEGSRHVKRSKTGRSCLRRKVRE